MTDAKQFVLESGGDKITLYVALNEGRLSVLSDPPQIPAALIPVYDKWLIESVVPTLLDWLPEEYKIAFALLGAKIMGKGKKEIDKGAQGEETEDK